MTYRQWMWGLSNGVVMLTLGGFVWLSLGLGTGLLPVLSQRWAWLFPVAAVVNLLVLIALLFGAMKLRRKARGFRLSETNRADERTQAETRAIRRGFRNVILLETVAIASVGLLCFYSQRPGLLWPLIGLVLGIHFVPFGRILQFRAYYFTGLFSTAFSLAALLIPSGPQRMLLLGYGMGLTAWISAIYIARCADRIASQRADQQRTIGPAV